VQPMTTVRNWQLDMLRKNLKVVGHIVENTSQADASTYRDGGDGWTVVEVVCHLRDWEILFLERARMTMTQEFPTLPNPNPTEAALEREYNTQNLQSVYAEWQRNRDLFLNFLDSIAETDWERAADHPVRGHFTLNDQLLLTAWHDVNHIEQITHILDERKPHR